MAELSLVVEQPLAGTFLTPEDHEDIDSLVHGLSEDSFTEVIRNSEQKVTEVKVLTGAEGTNVRQIEITRDPQGKVIQTIEKQFDVAGALIQTLTTDITRDSSGKVISIDATEVP